MIYAHIHRFFVHEIDFSEQEQDKRHGQKKSSKTGENQTKKAKAQYSSINKR